MFKDEAALLKAQIGAVLDLVIRPKEFPLSYDECMHVVRELRHYAESLEVFADRMHGHIVGVTKMVTSKGEKV